MWDVSVDLLETLEITKTTVHKAKYLKKLIVDHELYILCRKYYNEPV